MDMHINKDTVFLRPAVLDDIPMVEAWLNKEHVKKWFGEPEDWLAEIRNDDGKYGWSVNFIVMHEEKPIGFCSYGECSAFPDGFGFEHEPPGSYGIDYLIGEEAFLGKGIGSVMICLLCSRIGSIKNAVQVIADPVPENYVSIKLLKKNGFVFDAESGFYKRILRRHDEKTYGNKTFANLKRVGTLPASRGLRKRKLVWNLRSICDISKIASANKQAEAIL